MKNLIALTGAAGCGKTTAAMMLQNRRYYTVMSFADPLRAMLTCIGLEHADTHGGKHEPHDALCGRTPRHGMQTLGYDWGRLHIGEDIWVNHMRRAYLRAQDSGETPVIIDDCRFPNEARMVHDLGGIVIGIVRDSGPRMAHESERGIPGALLDDVVINDGDVEQLYARVCEAAKGGRL
jgi:hypothetical protein